ncbi:NADP-dependent oxidoreductase (plasmid) [Rhizorhabdus wittichii]|uniref:NADP-dependent oxidoreductase n=2 Tax=Rhizorhabdus wittichii TaxID=160791 RepID=A0A975D929_9SPHN|nr:NADP-dependent oxidoreductase [Rhizorhabdus wittichii]
MRAVQFSDYGSTDVLHLVDVPTPEPGDGQVRVAVAAAAVNPADYKWREGMFRDMAPLPLPHILGYDIAGTVDAVGPGVSDFAVGDRVFALLDTFVKGGYAQFAIARPEWLARVPAGLDLDVAASLPTAALAGMQIIENHVRPQAGDIVLITGAAGSVGRFAIHAAKQAGAQVVAAVLPSQQELALSLGADKAIVLNEEAPADIMFDHVADMVGGDHVAALCRRVKPGGRILTAATTPINPDGLPSAPVFFAVHPDGAGLARIGALVAQGTIPVASTRPLPLSEVAQAHRWVEAGDLTEKIILHP